MCHHRISQVQRPTRQRPCPGFLCWLLTDVSCETSIGRTERTLHAMCRSREKVLDTPRLTPRQHTHNCLSACCLPPCLVHRRALPPGRDAGTLGRVVGAGGAGSRGSAAPGRVLCPRQTHPPWLPGRTNRRRERAARRALCISGLVFLRCLTSSRGSLWPLAPTVPLWWLLEASSFPTPSPSCGGLLWGAILPECSWTF